MKYFYQFILCAVFINTIHSQCINNTAYGSAIINGCNTATISNCNWALEYSDLTFNATGTYTFGSSVSTDWLTLTTNSNVVIAFGQQPLVATIASTGGYRLHVTTDNACGTQNSCRVTTYACGSVSTTTGCIQPTAFGSATINSYGSSQITGCNYAGEYSELTISTAGLFTFSSSNSTDFLTLTDASNTILFSGTTPLATNITTLGNYRLHVSTSSACGTDNTCRITSYTCAPNTPCVGTPNAGITMASSSTLCGSQTINFSLSGSTVASGLSYQWQSSVNNITWVNMVGQTTSFMAQTISSTSYYRCVVACGTNTATSVSKLITINAMPFGGNTISSSSSVCFGNTINFSLSGNSSWPGLSYQWQSSSNNVSWTNIVGYTTPTISYAPNSATYFRCLLSCGSNTTASTSTYISAPPLITYATLPLYESFDNAWQNGCATRNIPLAINWSSQPSSGNNSWRRQDDGSSASWSSSFTGITAPQSGSGCANFHSSQVSANTKGNLDVYVNMNQLGKYAISYYYINPTGADNLNVLLSNDAGTSFSVKAFNGAQSTWTKKIIYYTTTTPSPQSIIRFEGEGANTSDDLGIDSLSVRFICLMPSVSATASSTVICAGQTTTLTANGANSYTWMPGNSTGNTAIVSPNNNTAYVLTATNDNLCFPTSVITISVSNCPIGIQEFETEKNILIYPNPTKNKLEIQFLSGNAETIILTDILGNAVFICNTLNQYNELNIDYLKQGIYFYQLLKGNKSISQGKIIKE